jgi:hypothetical protein
MMLLSLSNQNKQNLQVVPASNPKQSIGVVDDSGPNHLQEQYIQILSVSISFLKFPFIMDLISIVGESNLHLSSKLMFSIFENRPIIQKEFAMSLLETFQVCFVLYS